MELRYRHVARHVGRMAGLLAVHLAVGALCLGVVLGLAHWTVRLLISVYANIAPYAGAG